MRIVGILESKEGHEVSVYEWVFTDEGVPEDVSILVVGDNASTTLR